MGFIKMISMVHLVIKVHEIIESMAVQLSIDESMSLVGEVIDLQIRFIYLLLCPS